MASLVERITGKVSSPIFNALLTNSAAAKMVQALAEFIPLIFIKS